MSVTVFIDGKPRRVALDYSIHFRHDPLAGDVPVLYQRGQRVTQAWAVHVQHDEPRDPHGASGASQAAAGIVFTNGCFDLLHPGHVEFLERARALGNRLIVAINSDASVRRLKGQERPLCSVAERATMLRALRAVDEVTVFDEDTPAELVKELRPDVLVKGEGSTQPIPGAEFAGRVVLLPLVEGISTTTLIQRIAATCWTERLRRARSGKT